MNITFVRLYLLGFFALLLSSCGGDWHTMRSGQWQGQTYKVEERSRSGLFASTNSLDWRIQLARLPAVAVNANTTDWGPPYSTDIYATDAFLYITTKDTAYTSAPFAPGTIGVAHTMLYVSPKELSEEQFETFYAFMRDTWPKLSDSLAGDDLRSFPHIIGLVYGTQQQFERRFRGRMEGRAMELRIANDGRVLLATDDAQSTEHYSGLSGKVEMPGKRLALDTSRNSGGLTMNDLNHFKDAQGAVVTQVFDVYPISTPPGQAAPND